MAVLVTKVGGQGRDSARGAMQGLQRQSKGQREEDKEKQKQTKLEEMPLTMDIFLTPSHTP